MAVSINGTSGLTFNDGTSVGTASSLGMRNRIINGDMRINQRGTASVTFDTGGTYIVDRWTQNNSGGCTIVGQRSTTAPAGFTNSIDVTTSVGGAPSASQLRVVRQYIEGFNVADLQWGTAGALPVTVSFYIRSNVTGTFAVSITNSAFNRSQVQHFTINAANTFEYKTVTFSGDTTGTWLTDNGIGINLTFDLGSGSNYNAPSTGSWSGAYYSRTSSSVNLSSTTSNHIYLTGVQLEVGSVATPFERRLYPQELSMCQRYYSKTFNTDVAPVQNSNNYNSVLSTLTSSVAFTGNAVAHWRYPVQMRAVPTILLFTPGPNTSFIGCWTDSGGNYIAGSATNTGSAATFIYTSGGAASVNSFCYIHASASAEL